MVKYRGLRGRWRVEMVWKEKMVGEVEIVGKVEMVWTA
jgi:hypothetical protein